MMKSNELSLGVVRTDSAGAHDRMGGIMNRIRWMGIVLLIAGCRTTPPTPPPPLEPIPAPQVVNGAQVIFSDNRPAWEKTPFVASSVSLYNLAGTSPTPWALLAQETVSIVGAMPQKPERVEVAVASFRLVHKTGAARERGVDATGKTWGIGGMQPNTVGLVADATTPDAKGPDGLSQWLGVTSSPKESHLGEDPIDNHPPGTSCQLRATIKITFPGGRVQNVNVLAIANGESDTKYSGDARTMALKGAIQKYIFEFQQALAGPQAQGG